MSAETIDSVLSLVIPLMSFAALLWLIFWYLNYKRRRALNLTVAESARQDGVQPDFLKVDHDKRDAALRAGETFDAKIAARDAPQEPAPVVDKCRGAAKIVTILLALVTMLTGIVGALMRVEIYDEAVRRLGVWENMVAIITQYPLGFAIAVGIIAVTAFNAFRMVQRA